MKRWLAALMAMMLFLLPAVSMAAEYATITGGWLRLRTYPSYDSQTVASYYTGTKVEVLGTSGDWYHVRLSDGNSGYMHRDYLTLSESSSAGNGTENGSTATEGANATVVSSNGYGVRLRMGPGTSYRIIRSFPVGTPVAVIQRGTYWSKVKVGSYTGYMMSQFLSVNSSTYTGDAGNASGESGSNSDNGQNGSTDNSSTDSGSNNDPVTFIGDATIWSGNGCGVRLRSGPGTEYSKIGVYSVGTKVKLITKGAVWDYVQVGSRRGYMMNEFLLYNDHYTVTGVSINNLKPVVGNVLAVQSITPSSATVTYEWLVRSASGKETVKGTSAAYLVTDEDAGATIRLRITGTGNYKGTVHSKSTEAVVKTGSVDDLTLNILNPYVGDLLKPVITPADATVTYSWTVDGKEKSTRSSYTVHKNDLGKTITLTVTGQHPFNGERSVTTQPVKAMEAPVVETTGLPTGQFQMSYTTQLSAIGGGELKWSIIKGALPIGLALDQRGIISGTPTECGTKTFTVQVSNSVGKDTRELQLTINGVMVSMPTIDGVVVPTGGGQAVTAITPTEQYTGTVTWMPELTDGVFAPSTVYTAVISLTAKPNYTFTGLAPNYFNVSGSNGTSCTIGSDGSIATVTATFPATAAMSAAKLETPVITGIVMQDDAWVINWTKVENASGYMLRICDQYWIGCSTNSYILDGVPASGTYQVFATGDNKNYGDSDISDYVFTLPVAIPLNAPTGVTIGQSGDSWLLSWQPVANAVSYRVRKVGDPAGWQSVSKTDYALTTQPQSGDQFEVIATGDGVLYADSPATTYTYTVPVVKLAPPAELTITETDGVWKAEWSSVANATSYRFGDSLGNWYACMQPSFVFAGEPATGIYRVYAAGDGVAYIDSDVCQCVYAQEGYPEPKQLPAPTNLGIQEEDGVWIASWDEVPNAVGYRLRQSDEPWVECPENRYTFSERPTKTEYFVYAVGDGLDFINSPESSFVLNVPTAPQPLPAPASLTIQEQNGEWIAIWPAVPNATGYCFRIGTDLQVICEDPYYSFPWIPNTARYEVCALGDEIYYTDSPFTSLRYAEPGFDMELAPSVTVTEHPATVEE